MILYGASGHGKVIADILTESGVTEIQFWDDAQTASLASFNVIPTPEDVSDVREELILSIGSNKARKFVAEKLPPKIAFGRAIHPRSVISKRAEIAPGTVVMAGAVINIDTRIGKHCIINTTASLDHDCILEDYAHLSPNATLCGNVSVGEGTHVGAGSVVIQGIRIGKWCTIGAGSVIINDIPDFSTVVGNPGKIIKSTKK